jgi:hypothetical protein
VTASNQAGSTAVGSAPVGVAAARFKLLPKTRRPKARPGKWAKIEVQVYNRGDLRSKSSRVCVKLTKRQRKFVRKPKCKKIGRLFADQRKARRLNVKLKGKAKGSYKVKIVVKGTGGKARSARIKVVG